MSEKPPKDLNKLAKHIVDAATADHKDSMAVELGRRGGLKGGKARAKKLSPERRKEIAQKAAGKRWGKKSKEKEMTPIEKELAEIKKKMAVEQWLSTTFLEDEKRKREAEPSDR